MGKRLMMCAVAAVLVLGACGDDDEGEAVPLGDSGTTSSTGGGTTSSTAGGTTSSTAGEEALAFGEADADAVLDYDLLDYAFDGPREVQGSRIFFKATNIGTEDHELEVLDPDDEPVGEIEAMPPEAEGSVALVLEPGTYTLQCILETADGESHKDLGMLAELEVS